MTENRETREEEIASSVSHGVGLVATIAAAPLLIIAAVKRGDTAGVVGAAVFAATVVLVYLTSTLYHALPESRTKHLFLLLDHSAIYLLIAGTYTPFTLGVLRGAWGWSLLGLVWGLALAGITLKATGGLRYPRLSTVMYLAMGWLILIALKPVWLHVPPWGIFWLLVGGIAYSVGVVFFVAERLRYNHFIWHLFVMAGTACHFVAVLWYAG